MNDDGFGKNHTTITIGPRFKSKIANGNFSSRGRAPKSNQHQQKGCAERVECKVFCHKLTEPVPGDNRRALQTTQVVILRPISEPCCGKDNT